jgi:hypothetical protein
MTREFIFRRCIYWQAATVGVMAWSGQGLCRRSPQSPGEERNHVHTE